MKKLFKSIALFLMLAMLLSIVGCAGDQPEEPAEEPSGEPTEEEPIIPLKVALLMSGPITDGGWNTNAYNALVEAGEKYDIETAYTESVEVNDQTTLMRQYASKGFDLIIGNGFQYEDSAIQVASEFPDSNFWVFGGTVIGDNLASSQYWMGQTGYPIGALVGMRTKTGKVGFVIGTEDPTTMSEMRNMEAAALKYNPDVICKFIFTGDWADIQKAKEAAYALISDDCDVLVSCLDAATAGVIEACVEKDVWVVNVTNDAYEQAPNKILTSAVQDGKIAMLEVIRTFVENEFEGKIYRFGMNEGVMSIGTYGDSVTDEEKEVVESLVEQVKNNEIELISLT